MAVVNILKDGTIVDDMSKITVPQEITKEVVALLLEIRKEKKREKVS